MLSEGSPEERAYQAWLMGNKEILRSAKEALGRSSGVLSRLNSTEDTAQNREIQLYRQQADALYRDLSNLHAWIKGGLGLPENKQPGLERDWVKSSVNEDLLRLNEKVAAMERLAAEVDIYLDTLGQKGQPAVGRVASSPYEEGPARQQRAA